MKMIKKILLCVSALILVGGFSFFVFGYPRKAKVENRPVPPEASIRYAPEWNFRQSVNSCGPYSAAAVIRIVTKQDVSSEDIVKTTPWRYRGYTLPFGIVSELERHRVNVDERIVALPDLQKISWLRDKISKNTPVILLIRKNGLLHYVTLLGYKDKTFDVYDSLETRGQNGLTIDANGVAPGNITWTNEALLEAWNQGGLFGLYKNFAIYPVFQ